MQYEMEPTTAASITTSQNPTNDSMLQRNGNFIVRGSFGIAYTLVMFAVLALVCVNKAYKTSLQRIILYHIILTLFCEMIFSLQLVLDLHIKSPTWTCEAAIYLWMYSKLAWHTYTTAVTTYLFSLGCCLIRGKYNIQQGGKVAEFICAALAICFPLVYILASYKEIFEVVNCHKLISSKWNKNATILSVIILAMCTEVITVCVTLCIMFIFLNRQLRNNRLNTLMKHLLKLIGINASIMLFITLIAAYCVYRYLGHPPKSITNIFQIIYGIGYPSLFALSMIVHSLVSIQCRGYARKILCCKRREQGREVINPDSGDNFTNPSSHPVNQPSHTYFSVPYTGAFTEVTLPGDDHEEMPLLMHK